jgi:hydroxyquinol 1,2-dioxygenase
MSSNNTFSEKNDAQPPQNKKNQEQEHPPSNSITQQVLERLQAETPRTQEILQKLVNHLHALIQDVQPTQDEWFTAIDFLTRTGQKCDDTRQEFILLSDVLGVSMLVDSIHSSSSPKNTTNDDAAKTKPNHHPLFPKATESTVQGPFHVPSDPAQMGDQLAKGPEQARGAPTRVSGVVHDAATGQPIPNASIDVWQSDDRGQYDLQQQDAPHQLLEKKKNLRATFTTSQDGRYWFRTIRPASYPVPTDGPVGELLHAMGRHAMRPAHIHFMVEAPGYRRLVTHLFVKGDPYLDSDAVFGVKESLIVEFQKESATTTTTDDGGGGSVTGYQVEFDVGLVPKTSDGMQ